MSKLTFIGHASFRLDTPQAVVYIDPWLDDNPACPRELKTVDRADLVLVTHGHRDHLDPDLPEILRRTGAAVSAPSVVLAYLKEKGVEKIEMLHKGGSFDFLGLRVTMANALHAADIQDEGRSWPHESCTFIVRGEGVPTLFFGGDTGIFSEMELIGRMYRPQVAVLPIGDRMTMGPYEAAWAARLLGAPIVVPMHYGSWPALVGTPEELRRELAGERVEIVEMTPGQTLDLDRRPATAVI